MGIKSNHDIAQRFTPDVQKQKKRLMLFCDSQPRNISNNDNISYVDNKHDSSADMSYFVASCVTLKKYFPRIMQIYVQSDNSKYYKTLALVFAMFEKAQQNGL